MNGQDPGGASASGLASSASIFRLLKLIGESVWQRNLVTDDVSVTAGLWTGLGYPEDRLPRTLGEAMATFHPDDAVRVLAEMEEYLAHGAGAYLTTARVRSADGAWRWLRFSGAVLTHDTKGQPLVVGGLMSDISQELQREQDRVTAEGKIQRLSERERQVLEGIVEGQTSKEIALALRLSPRTVEFYRNNLMEKLEVTGVPALVRLVSAAEWPRSTQTASAGAG